MIAIVLNTVTTKSIGIVILLYVKMLTMYYRTIVLVIMLISTVLVQKITLHSHKTCGTTLRQAVSPLNHSDVY